MNGQTVFSKPEPINRGVTNHKVWTDYIKLNCIKLKWYENSIISNLLNNETDLGKALEWIRKNWLLYLICGVKWGTEGCIMSVWIVFSRLQTWTLTCHNRLSNTSRKKKKNSTMKRHIMFLETLTWRQITDLFKKVFQKNIKNSLSWQGERGQVVYRSWPVPFSLNIHVQTETNWDWKSKHKSVWGSCWLSQWNKTRLSTTVHLQETVMTGRTKEKTHAHTQKKGPNITPYYGQECYSSHHCYKLTRSRQILPTFIYLNISLLIFYSFCLNYSP